MVAAVPDQFHSQLMANPGDILQKFINYQVKLAIVGDFSVYENQSLRDFIYESNKGKDIFFLPNEQQAVEKLIIV